MAEDNSFNSKDVLQTGIALPLGGTNPSAKEMNFNSS